MAAKAMGLFCVFPVFESVGIFMISEIRSNDDYDITIRRDNKKAAVGAVKNGDAEAAFSADKDCRRVKIYLDGSNASDAKIIRAVIEQSAAKVVRDNAENAVSDLKKTMADNPAAPDIDIEMAEPDITAKYIYGTEDGSFLDSYGAPLIGAIIFFFVFLIAGINFLNERKGGTLERILSTPAKRSEIIAGYVLGFGALAVVQTIVLTLFVVYVLGMIFLTMRETKKQTKEAEEKKRGGKTQEETVNPYKVAKKTGKSVEEIVAEEEKKKARAKAKAERKKKQEEEEEEEGIYKVHGPAPVSKGGSKYKTGRKALAEKKKAEAAAKRAEQIEKKKQSKNKKLKKK